MNNNHRVVTPSSSPLPKVGVKIITLYRPCPRDRLVKLYYLTQSTSELHELLAHHTKRINAINDGNNVLYTTRLINSGYCSGGSITTYSITNNTAFEDLEFTENKENVIYCYNKSTLTRSIVRKETDEDTLFNKRIEDMSELENTMDAALEWMENNEDREYSRDEILEYMRTREFSTRMDEVNQDISNYSYANWVEGIVQRNPELRDDLVGL